VDVDYVENPAELDGGEELALVTGCVSCEEKGLETILIFLILGGFGRT